MAPPRGGVDLEAYYGGPEKPPRDRRSSSAAAHTASPVFSLRAALQRTDCPASPCPPPRKDPTPCTTFEQLLCSCGLPRGMLSFGFGGRHIKRSDDAPRDQSDVRPADDDAAAYGCAVRLLIGGEVREHDVCAALVRRGWRRAVAERVSYDLRRVTGVDPADVEKPPKAIEAAAGEPATKNPPAPAPPPPAPPSPGSSSWGSAPASPVGTWEEPAAPPPDDGKYARMLAMGVPATAVEHKMRSQGLDEASIARALAAAPRRPAPAPAAPRRARGGLPALDARLGADDYERLRPALPSDGECGRPGLVGGDAGRDAASLGAAERFVDAAGRAGDRAGLSTRRWPSAASTRGS
ncbi:hypothetical protein JL721_8771 [Aureococcus anophagefferens]|nr:hypothetical protein JL721_8771 [Aureococcus anophagefferens]